MCRFLSSVTDQMFAERFLFLINTRTRNPVAAIVRGHFPFFLEIDILFVFFRRPRGQVAQQLPARLVPIGVGKFVWIALVDHRNLARTSFDVLGGRNSHSVPMKLNFAATRFLFFHTLKLRKPNQVYVQKVTAANFGRKEDFARGAIAENSWNFMDDCKLLPLKSGGQLAYVEYGSATGTPVFFFHGWPSSRTMAQLTDAAARELGVRIISPDRPGIRDSSFQPNRKLVDWPQIVEQLADHLEIERFRILAISGGAPYAYAAAWRFPKRVLAVAIASGAPPIVDLGDDSGLLSLYRRMLWLHRCSPQTLRVLFYLAGAIARIRPPVRFRPLVFKLLKLQPCDAASLEDSVAFEACFESQRRAWRASVKGLTVDAEIFAAPWGFRLEDVDVPVRLWHGTKDRAFSTRVAEYVTARLPNCTTRYVEGEGHYSVPIRHMREILADLIAV